MISFENFKKKTVQIVKELVPGAHVFIVEQVYDYGISYGLSMKPKGYEFYPILSLNGAYQEILEKGYRLENYMMAAVKKMLSYQDNNIQEEFFLPYGKAKERVFFCLINKKMNEDLLTECPYVQWLDFAIVFRYMIENNDDVGFLSCLVDNSLMKWWQEHDYCPGLPELYRDAKKATPNLLPLDHETPEKIREEILKVQKKTGNLKDLDVRFINGHMVSNTIRCYGSGTVLYKNVVRDISDSIGGQDLILLPSSTREWMIFPSDGSPDEMETHNKHVRFVNNTKAVPEGFILSDHAYKYLRDQDKIIY